MARPCGKYFYHPREGRDMIIRRVALLALTTNRMHNARSPGSEEGLESHGCAQEEDRTREDQLATLVAFASGAGEVGLPQLRTGQAAASRLHELRSVQRPGDHRRRVGHLRALGGMAQSSAVRPSRLSPNT